MNNETKAEAEPLNPQQGAGKRSAATEVHITPGAKM